MATVIKPQELLKRLFKRYYPVILLFSLLSSYGAYFIFPDENVPLLLLMFQLCHFFLLGIINTCTLVY